MKRLSVFADSSAHAKLLGDELAGLLDITYHPRDAIDTVAPDKYTLVDCDLDDRTLLPRLRDWVEKKPRDAKMIFVTRRGSHLQNTRARALGATDILHHPFDARMLLAKLWGDVGPLAIEADEAAARPPGVVAAIGTLQSAFSSALAGGPLDHAAVDAAGHVVVGQVEEQGIGGWIDAVRRHHSQTYQHCMLVTGLAVAFGQYIGVSRADQRRLSVAGMLHDIGKARIPLAILEKPGPLDADEMAVMKLHPQHGYDALVNEPQLAPEMLDIVVHHHEYLDGSGYPHGLQAHEISDLVRIVTIVDIFGALIERRSYRPPMPNDAAYQVLLNMGPKLDKDLVRAFRFASRIQTAA
jgi:putative nucleotidyltransferase with HDIG domain